MAWPINKTSVMRLIIIVDDINMTVCTKAHEIYAMFSEAAS